MPADSKLGGLFGGGPKSLSEDLAELREDLKTLNPLKQRSALHRVITLLSSGRNVSQLFPEVLNAMHSTQLDTKRLSHQFFLIYHRQFPDLSLLAINALKKDADDPNPLVRALSLRTLAAIRLEEAAEYLVDPVRKGLVDSDPYVRKSAVLAVGKLCHFHRPLVADHGLVELVLDLLSDGNPAVVGNAAATIGEFLACRVAVSFDLGRANALLTALTDCNEWQMITILDLLYQVNSVFTEEVDKAVQRLVPLLSHGNAGVVLGAVRIMSVLISRCTDISLIRSVLGKLVPPLVSFLGDSSGGAQSSALHFEILRSINILASKKTGVKMPLGALLIKYADPMTVKKEKIKLLAKLDFGQGEADRVLIELKEIAATELDVSVVVSSVEALASLALRPVAPYQPDKVVSALLDILDAQGTTVGPSGEVSTSTTLSGSQKQPQQPAVVSAQTQIKACVLVNLVAMIRAFPGEFEAVIATIIEAWASLSAVQAQVTDAVAYVVAENAARVDTETALSVFDRIFTSEAELSSVVLSSTLRLAIAINNKPLLKKVIERATAPLSSIDPDIRDRGQFYYKLIQTDPAAARDILNAASGKQVRKTSTALSSRSFVHLDLSHIGRLSSMYDQTVSFHRRPPRQSAGDQHDQSPKSRGGDNDDEDDEDDFGPAAVHSSSTYRPASLVITPSASATVPESTTAPAVASSAAAAMRTEVAGADSEEEDSEDEMLVQVAKVAKFLVLKADQPGAPGGVKGLRVAGGVGRTSEGVLVLALTVGNGAVGTSLHLTGPFLIQLNKNPAGVTAKTKLIAGSTESLRPGEAFNGYVELLKTDAMKQGTGTLTSLQVAIKTKEDVWYFSVPFPISVAFSVVSLMPKRPSRAADLVDPRDKMKTDDRAEEEFEAEEMEFEDPFEDEIEEEEIVDDADMQDEDAEDEDEDQEEAKVAVFRPGVDELAEDEELVPAEGAYKFLHKLELDWPCLSFDFIDPPSSASEMKYPLDVTVVAGTQADRSLGNDKLYVTHWSKLRKNHKSEEDDEDEDDSDSSDDSSDEEDEDEETGDGELRFRQIPLSGGASNRVRAMPQMRSIVSVFSEDGKVRVFNVQKAVEEVHQTTSAALGGVMNIDPLFECAKHTTEGYGLAWNPAVVGQLVSGDERGRVNLWLPVPGGSWEVVEMLGERSGETAGVMDVAWKDGHVFATAHSGGAVKLWDARSGGSRSSGGSLAVKNEGGVDVNAVAWNPKVGELVLTGNDDGSFKIYDARNFKVHLAHFHWHKEQITSVAWHPTDETTLLVASGDDSISFWDMSVEADEEDEEEDERTDYPAQLLFLHQGQQWIKEAKFTTKYPDAVASTAADGFNFFRTCNI